MKRLLYLFLALSLILPQCSFAKDYGSIDGKINDLMQVVSDSGELASATTSVTINNLDGDTDKEYELIVRSKSASALEDVALGLNNDFANCGYQSVYGEDSTVGAVRDTSEAGMKVIRYSVGANLSFSTTKIQAKSGRVRTAITKMARGVNGTSVSAVALYGFVWNNTADNITSMVVQSEGASDLDAGSRIILLKKVDATSGKRYGAMNIKGRVKNAWQEVTRGTLTGASTSITISNLTGNTDVLYRLRYRYIGGSASASYPQLRPNNDTGSNYGSQEIYASNTSTSATRYTGLARWIVGNSNTQNYLGYGEILIYAKSGYVRSGLATVMQDTTGTTVGGIFLYGYAWNDTTNEITSLVFYSSETDGFGIGSFYVLEKLNLN